LIGDAAHNIHPIAGQGLNLGIKDVASLAETLVYATRLGQDIGSTDILERYSNWRKFDVLSMGIFTDLSNRFFSNDNNISRLTRGLGLFLISQNSTLKRAIVKEAAGISGDIPKLMRGASI
jgi:2-octaprenyl-6-methoxyphenol hydroxylase